MIIIYINGEGTAEKLSPQHVYQGSNQTGVTVFAPVPTTTAMSIAFKLPDKTNTPYYPMTFIQSVQGLTQYEFTIPSSITQLAGEASIALRALYSDGQQTSQLIELEIETSVLPELPEDIDQNAYDIIMQRLQADRSDITTLQGQIGHIEELSEQAQEASANAVETANEAKSAADGLAESIAQANTTAGEANNTANEAKNTAQDAKTTADGLEDAIDSVRENVEAIEEVIPSGASENNQLADKAFVNSSINNMAAFYITYNANGDAFPTRADLFNATTYYNGGQVRVPTQNDYAIVLADESQPVGIDGSYPTTRYSYQGSTWSFQYIVNDTAFTQAQLDAINSGITKAIVDALKQGAVVSVNGETGAVTITPTNIGAVDKNGDSMEGPLQLADVNPCLITSANNGVQFDTYGNIIHKKVQTGDTWHIDDADGTKAFKVQFDNGDITAKGNVYTNGGGSQRKSPYQVPTATNIDTEMPVDATPVFIHCEGATSGTKPTDNGNYICSCQSSRNYGCQVSMSDNGNSYFRKLAGGKWSSWETFLKTDPNKLSPSTENGWTIGNNQVLLPEAGIYLICFNDAPSIGIMVYPGDMGASGNNASCLIGPFQVGGDSSQVYYRVSSGVKWTVTNLNTNAQLSVSKISYKKIL